MAARRKRKKRLVPVVKLPGLSTAISLTQTTLTISDLSRSGAGIGRDENGRVVFVPFTAPGDVVKVKIHNQKSKFAEATILEIIAASSIRVTPRCQVFTKCGGCQWQHLPYALQWQTKLDGVKESLRLAKVTPPHDWDSFPAMQIWEYRNRIQLRGTRNALGFYARNTNTLVPIQRCEIVQPAINQVLDEVLKEADQSVNTFKVELAVSPDGSVQRVWNSEHGASGFRQVNDEQNANLQQWILGIVKSRPGVNVLDLYGGSGNLSIPLSHLVNEAHCVDIYINNEDKIKQDIPHHYHFHDVPVIPWLQKRANEIKGKIIQLHGNPWLAICDPPRGGVGQDVATMINALEAHRVDTLILVGCKTDPWSRDIAQFIQRGWRLTKVAVFDFFPQTYHVESVGLLQR